MADHTTENDTVKKLQTVADNGGGIATFTAEEAVVLRRVIKLVAGAEALGWIGGGLRTILLTVGAIYMAYIAFWDWLVTHWSKP